MPRRHSRAEAEIQARLEGLDPESPRYQVLLTARDFRASWVKLGEQLTEVREKQQHRGWGYPSFEAYCRRELRLRQETANKLTRSFGFMRDHQPAALEERAARELPPLDVVDLLSQARERAKISDRDFATIQEEVFATDAAPTRNSVVKRLREVDPEAFRGTVRPKASESGEVSVDMRKALLLAERLAELLEGVHDLPAAALEGARTAARLLKQRFEATRKLSA